MTAPYHFDGAALRREREGAGLRREEVAVSLRKSVASIEGYERGNVNPPADVVARLADTLGCEPGDLFTRKPEPAL